MQDTSDLEDGTSKSKHQDNSYMEPSQQQTVVDMKGEFVLLILMIYPGHDIWKPKSIMYSQLLTKYCSY